VGLLQAGIQFDVSRDAEAALIFGFLQTLWEVVLAKYPIGRDCELSEASFKCFGRGTVNEQMALWSR